MESLSSDEDGEKNCRTAFWNNWLPKCKFSEVKYRSDGKRFRNTRQTLLDFSDLESSRIGNWIPPQSFLRNIRSPTPKTSVKHTLKGKRNARASENENVAKKVRLLSENGMKASPHCSGAYGKQINLDWGERRQLHDVRKFNEGDVMWGVVHLGVFSSMKLWINEYGNTCCLATGKICKIGSAEVTFICMNDTELLRKMLNVSSSQWASLCETIKETKTVLKFDAFQVSDLKKTSSLERLWFFLCKRRHLLPPQCMLIKYDGAVKCMRKFEIRPKLLVQDVRNVIGEPFS